MSVAPEKDYPVAVYDQTIELPEPTDDVSQGLRNIREFGLTIHKGIISKEFAAQLQERMEEQAFMERKLGGAYIGAQMGAEEKQESKGGEWEAPIYQAMNSLPNKGRVFIDLFMNKTAHQYADAVFAPHSWCLWGQNGIITRKGSVDQLLHADAYSPNEMNARCPVMNCFISINGMSREMGATGFAPRTQNGPYPDRSTLEPFTTPRVQPEHLDPGDAIIWDGRTWHGQCAHYSDQARYAIAMSFCLFTYRQGENYAASLHDSVYETLSEEELRVLGFYTEQEEFLGYFGPRNADDKRRALGTNARYLPEMHRDDQ